MSRDGNPAGEQDRATNRMAGLVASLRTIRTDNEPSCLVRRSVNLEAVLPEGHRARLIWDYVVGGAGRDGMSMAPADRAAGGPPPQVLLTLWIYAYSKGIGGARDLAELCKTHPGFRWICAGTAVSESQLSEFRMHAPNSSDEMLAECLAGLKVAGVLGTRSKGGAVPALSESQLLAALDEMRNWVRTLRRQLESPLSDRLQRHSAVVAQRRSERQKRAGSALDVLKRVIDAQGTLQQRQDALLRQAARAKVARPLVMTVRPVLGGEPILPWSLKDEDDRRFYRALATSMAVLLVVSAVLTLVTLPPIERAEAEKIPPRLAKLVLEKTELPKAQPVKIDETKAKELPVEKTVEKAAPEAAPEVSPGPQREAAPSKPGTQQLLVARERASRTGLVAMRDQLAALRDLSSESLSQNQVSVGVEGTEQRTDRDLIGATATAGSGGIAGNAVAYGGGGTLASHKTTQVRGPTGAATLAEITKEARSGKRSNEDIKFGFDANKSALDSIYRRALRENPTLEGRVVFKLSVEASGQVSACTIASSELKDPALEAKLVSRVLLINFVARPGVEVWNKTFEIQFVPTS